LGLLVVYSDALTAGIADAAGTAATTDHNTRPWRQQFRRKPPIDFSLDSYIVHDA
jgi:hypothetical protein